MIIISTHKQTKQKKRSWTYSKTIIKCRARSRSRHFYDPSIFRLSLLLSAMFWCRASTTNFTMRFPKHFQRCNKTLQIEITRRKKKINDNFVLVLTLNLLNHKEVLLLFYICVCLEDLKRYFRSYFVEIFWSDNLGRDNIKFFRSK